MKHPYITKFRKTLALTAMLLLLVSLTGCWKKDEPDSTGDTQGQTPPPSSSAPTETATLAPSESLPDDVPPEPLPDETEAPATEAPTEAPTAPPATEAPAPKTIGTVNTTKLNIRKDAGTGYASVGVYYKGDKVEILETKNGWGRTDKGWVFLDYLDFEETVEKEQTDPNAKDGDIISNGNSQALGHAIVDLKTLNVRSGPGTNYDALTTVSSGQRYAYYQERDGWVRIDKGWVYTSYLYIEGKTGEGAGTGTIHSANPNIRSGPGVDFEVVGSYKKGETVKILAQINKWGYTDKGWVSMSYVGMKVYPTGMGTVTADTLNIRKQAKVDSTQVGTYAKDDIIEILETKSNWGRTDKGWVCLDYVQMDAAARTISSSNTGTVTASALNIRKDANINAETLGAYAKGEKVEILETKNGWGRTDKGWVYMEYVKMDAASRTITEPETKTESKTGKGTVTASGLHIRKDTDTKSESLGGYKKGDRVEILETKNGWGRTDKGWIWLEYVKMDS